jgi:hypothetical protein
MIKTSNTKYDDTIVCLAYQDGAEEGLMAGRDSQGGHGYHGFVFSALGAGNDVWWGTSSLSLNTPWPRGMDV